MPFNRLWTEIEKDDLGDFAAMGGSEDDIIARHIEAYPDRTPAGVHCQLATYDLFLPPSDGIERRVQKKTIEEQDADFCEEMLVAIITGGETDNGRWNESTVTWSSTDAVEEPQQWCGSDSKL